MMYDPNAQTQPVQTAPRPEPIPEVDPLSRYQRIRVPRQAPVQAQRRRRKAGCGGCLLPLLALAVPLLLVIAAYLFFPGKTTVLLLGIDRAPDGTAISRSDTIMLVSAEAMSAEVHMLSIPRDLWVNIPGVGENRINTAHFFAEGNQEGSGPQAVIDTISANFGVTPRYYARVQFSGFSEVVDALGGVTLNLDEPMGGLEAGKHHLDGAQALAFARDRKGTDDFFRMKQGQVVLIATARQLLNPLTWPRLPFAAAKFFDVVDTNLPVWEWPRLAVTLLRAGPDGVDNRTITREMVYPFQTDGGAQVLGPNWDLIRPMMAEMFGE